MSEEKFKVTTVVSGRENSFIWDPSLPCSLDTLQQWVLESKDSGIRVRYLGAKNYELCPNSAIPIDEQTIQKKFFTRLPATALGELKFKLQRLKNINPVYTSQSKSLGPEYQLMAFSGVGKALLVSQPVHHAYVAYVRKNPMFTIYLHTEKSKLNNKEVNEDKYWIRPLLPGVRLKLKGQRSISGEIGEDWKLSREQMLSSTVIRGSYWWKFNAFETSNNLNDILNPRTWEDRQNRQVLKSVGIFSLLFTIFALVVGLWPQQKKVLQKVEEIPVVKFIAPKKKMILESPVQKPPEKKAAAPVAQVPASNLKSEVRVEEKKQTKEKVSKPPILKPVPNEPKIQMPPPAPKPDPRKMAAEAAAKKMASLRSLLGGALNITKTPVVNKLQSNRAAPVFGNSGSPIAATQIRPGYVSTRGGVGAVGGSSQGGASYASGERAVVGSGKATFVPVDSGGVSVEQGLTQEEVGAVIYSHLAEVRYCHDTAVLYTPRLEGKLLVKFSINGQGRVVKAGVESSDLPEHMLEKCILKKLATWKFPIPKGGIVVSVGYPFIFKTLGRE